MMQDNTWLIVEAPCCSIKPAVHFLAAVNALLRYLGVNLCSTIDTKHMCRAHLFNVVERMLRDVRHARVGVLPHDALLGLHLTRQQLDQRALARAICLQVSTSIEPSAAPNPLQRRPF